jgi:hypothetical protein
VSYRPDLAALLVDPGRVAALTDAVYRVALVDLLEVRTLVGAVFGDGVRVVGSGPAGPWPPAGCWFPTSARTIDSNGTTVPTAGCLCCGAMMWGFAGSGWCCRRYHSDPLAPRSETAEVVDAIVFELARRADFPPVPLARAVTVLPGESAWRRFAIAGGAADRATARATLRAMLGECESVEHGTPERTRI